MNTIFYQLDVVNRDYWVIYLHIMFDQGVPCGIFIEKNSRFRVVILNSLKITLIMINKDGTVLFLNINAQLKENNK